MENGNEYIAQQRAKFAAELASPSVHDEVCAMMITEDGVHPAPCFESLLNRTLYVNSRGWNRTLRQMIQGGFYGPYNRGMYPRTIQQLHNSPVLQARMNAAIASVMAGSDDIRGFTDQGLPTDPNGMRQPQLKLGGNIFNDWGGGPDGHDGAEAWRAAFEAAAYGAFSEPGLSPAGYPLAKPIIGLHTTKNLQAALNYLGAQPYLDVDGQYGYETLTAVAEFQVMKKLTVDGIIGPETWTAIDEDLSK